MFDHNLSNKDGLPDTQIGHLHQSTLPKRLFSPNNSKNTKSARHNSKLMVEKSQLNKTLNLAFIRKKKTNIALPNLSPNLT